MVFEPNKWYQPKFEEIVDSYGQLGHMVKEIYDLYEDITTQFDGVLVDIFTNLFERHLNKPQIEQKKILENITDKLQILNEQHVDLEYDNTPTMMGLIRPALDENISPNHYRFKLEKLMEEKALPVYDGEKGKKVDLRNISTEQLISKVPDYLKKFMNPDMNSDLDYTEI